MSKVDDLGIEIDDELERAMADPKSGILTKAVDYLLKRNEVKKQKEAEELARKNKPVSMFNGMFD